MQKTNDILLVQKTNIAVFSINVNVGNNAQTYKLIYLI